MRYPLVLDLETKYTFRQQTDPKNLEVSVVGIYNYKDRSLKCFEENELPKLFPFLEEASFIIGFNIDNFDLPVLQKYYPGKITQFKTLDILEEIKKIIGRRLALNDVIFATLGKRKTGHGLQAINYYQEGKIDELKKYCLDDVMLTKELFDYGVKNGKVYYLDVAGKASIKVDWKRLLTSYEKTEINLTLPL